MLKDHTIDTIREINTKSYTLRVRAVVEDWPIQDSYDPEAYDVEDMARKVDRGLMDWFGAVAEIIHKPTGLVLGSEAIGGFLYDDCREFRGDPYERDIVQEAIRDARETIQSLCGSL